MKSNKKTTLSQAIHKQELWRQKQIHILYASGRPIFNNNNWKQKLEYPIFPHYVPTTPSYLLR
jgi:hypothetical protein|tara:strand:- start:843 stop:1031 length:189 start_codon:yes stop_codon:yes gene_type:complete